VVDEHHLLRVVISGVLSVALSLLMACDAFAQNPAVDVAASFEVEAPKAWRRYRELVRDRLQCTWTWKSTNEKGEFDSAGQTQIRQAPDRRLIQMDISSPEPNSKDIEGELGGWNPDYLFALKRSNTDRPWQISSVVRGKPMNEWSANTELERLVFFPVTFAPVFNGLDAIPTAAGFERRQISECLVDERKCVRVEFDYSPEDKMSRTPRIAGAVVYEPNRMWVARRFDVTLSWEARKDIKHVAKTVELEYSDRGELPLLSKVVSRLESISETRTSVLETRYDIEANTAVPNDQVFQLSDYGFKEPEQRGSNRWLVAYAITGVLMIVLAVALHRLRGRIE
jgi:hypothetical protein